MRGFAILVGMIWLFPQPTAACNCPKEQLAEQNGSVSMLGGLAKVRPGPLRPVADPVLADPGPGFVLDLPWLQVISEKPRSGTGLRPSGFDPFALALPEL